MAEGRRTRVAVVIIAVLSVAFIAALIMITPHTAAGGATPMLVVLPLILIMVLLTVLAKPWLQPRPDGSQRTGVQLFRILAPATFYALAMALFAATTGGSILVGLLKAMPMLLVFLGIGFASMAVRRVGTELSCAKCHYPMDAEVEAAPDLDQRCPECGAFWKRRGGTVRGHKERRNWAIAAAALLVALGFAAIFTMRSTTTRQLALLPTGSLIKQITTTGSFTMDEWAVLSKRTLSQRQRLTLAEGLLAKRAQRQYLGDDEEAWFEAAVLANQLPAEIAQRYFRGMLELWIDAPDSAEAGQPLSIGVGSDHRGSLRTPSRTTLSTFVYFAGFRVDGGEAQARADTPAHGITFGRVRRSWGQLDRTWLHGARPSPEIEATLAPPGPLRISAEYWLIVAPPATMPASITWQADGQPQIPPTAAWAERIFIEKTIALEP